MMKDDTLPADFEATLDEHVAWVTAVAKHAEHRGAPAIQEAIANLDDEQKDGMLFVLLSIVSGSVARTREAIRDEMAKQQFDGSMATATLPCTEMYRAAHGRSYPLSPGWRRRARSVAMTSTPSSRTVNLQLVKYGALRG